MALHEIPHMTVQSKQEQIVKDQATSVVQPRTMLGTHVHSNLNRSSLPSCSHIDF
jgi:hypothetical protein